MSLDVDAVLKTKSLTRSKLAEKLGRNRSYVTNALKNPTLETLEKIAEALDVDIRDLFSPSSDGGILNGYVEYKGTVYTIKSQKDLKELLKLTAQD